MAAGPWTSLLLFLPLRPSQRQEGEEEEAEIRGGGVTKDSRVLSVVESFQCSSYNSLL